MSDDNEPKPGRRSEVSLPEGYLDDDELLLETIFNAHNTPCEVGDVIVITITGADEPEDED